MIENAKRCVANSLRPCRSIFNSGLFFAEVFTRIHPTDVNPIFQEESSHKVTCCWSYECNRIDDSCKRS